MSKDDPYKEVGPFSDEDDDYLEGKKMFRRTQISLL